MPGTPPCGEDRSRRQPTRDAGPGETEGDVADEVNLLITATWTVAARTGSFEPSVREILQEAGVSTKAFYRHFRSKDDLLLVALETASCQLADYIESKMAPLDAPVPRIRVWLEGFMRQAIVPSAARRTLPWALGVGQLAHLYPDEFDHSKALVIAPLEREITEAVARGTAMSPNPARDARIIFGYTMDAIRHHLIRRTEPDRRTPSSSSTSPTGPWGSTPPIDRLPALSGTPLSRLLWYSAAVCSELGARRWCYSAASSMWAARNPSTIVHASSADSGT